MRPLLLFTCFLMLLPAIQAGAEYYRYVDSNGVLCFTDDFGQVPENYWDQIVAVSKR